MKETIKLGKKIYQYANQWLQQAGYQPKIEIEEFSFYFTEKSGQLREIYRTIAEGGSAGDIVEKIGHCLHEIVELSEEKKTMGPLKPVSEMLGSVIQIKAHEIANKWEEKFLREANREEIKKEFKEFQRILQKEKKEDQKIAKYFEKIMSKYIKT